MFDRKNEIFRMKVWMNLHKIQKRTTTELFFITMDQVISALELKFNLLNSHDDAFEFLYEVYELRHV